VLHRPLLGVACHGFMRWCFGGCWGSGAATGPRCPGSFG
jgi:hypothetical protein